MSIAIAVLLASSVASAQTPAAEANRLIAAYHEDVNRLDRARELLEQALARDSQVETMIQLSRAFFLTGEVRAKTQDEKLAAYDRGRELGRRAVELAPRSEDAHFWYMANTGRWGQTKGIMRSLFLLPTVREELDTLMTLNPNSARTHHSYANMLFELPGLAGGDRAKAETHWKKSFELDPHYTVARNEYARLLIATGRYEEARRALKQVLDEKTPTIPADWVVRDVPRAKALLKSIQDKR